MATVHPEFELLPCPLCGGPAQVEHGMIVWAVTCPCGSHVFYGCENSGEKTAEAWNKRAKHTCHDEHRSTAWFTCSECGAYTIRESLNPDVKIAALSYCPHCGAKVVE